ncbi:hypothetical protein MK805_12095 [Shimazuella sp. AN120528]|uniref:hypothetical protein n=1 Tax=Shimazuella soli TaxID=1892854 RepID=UPI001F0E2F3F|nr:hypothetical protein [Shimazuella soli]MCH5585686.1 hypothetical protein [Shimazuella soli]
MLKTLHGFGRSVLPFFEVILLSFVIGIALRSSATAIVAFLFLIVTVYFWSSLVLSFGWAIATVLILTSLIPNQSIIFQVIMGVIVGGLRYLILKVRHRL